VISIDVELTVPPHLTASALEAAPRRVRDEFRRTIAGDVLLLEGEIVGRAPVGVAGTLRAATTTEVRGELLDLTGRVFNPTIYGAAVDQGSDPHTPPLANIERWARRVIGGTQVQRTARAIWASIRRKGTKAHPFWGVSWKAMEPTIRERHVAMLARVKRILGGEA
jgi:hypothetical protein